eukprot:10269986-Alexandrium_andersonii.AAC.1
MWGRGRRAAQCVLHGALCVRLNDILAAAVAFAQLFSRSCLGFARQLRRARARTQVALPEGCRR